jgi:hypothetical protein
MLGIGVILLLGACSKATPQAARQAQAVAPAAVVAAVGEKECSLATPLEPGVPGSPGHLMPSERNPNGQSELSALMRSMQSELKVAREVVARGEKVGPFLPRWRKIRCAWPTHPAERNEQFDAFARSYLLAVEKLDSAAPAQVGPAYDGVLNACRACHEQSCSGAIVAIEALRLGGISAAAP